MGKTNSDRSKLLRLCQNTKSTGHNKILIARSLRACELELAFFHIDATAAKLYSFRSEAKPLLDGLVAAELDFSTCAQHTLPGHSKPSMQDLRHQPCTAGKPRRPRHGAIGRHFALGNFSNRRFNALALAGK
jgi:hypothetical protein